MVLEPRSRGERRRPPSGGRLGDSRAWKGSRPNPGGAALDPVVTTLVKNLQGLPSASRHSLSPGLSRPLQQASPLSLQSAPLACPPSGPASSTFPLRTACWGPACSQGPTGAVLLLHLPQRRALWSRLPFLPTVRPTSGPGHRAMSRGSSGDIPGIKAGLAGLHHLQQ